MNKGFWDKIASKIGYDHSHIDREIIGESGEDFFKNKILSFSSLDSIVLDIGTSDGMFPLSFSDKFKLIIGIDSSKEMIKKAHENKFKQKNKNVFFLISDVYNLPFKKQFDIVYSRRGPGTQDENSLSECIKAMKDSGWFLEITIGEKDCDNLVQIFRRGQMYGIEEKKTQSKSKLLTSCGLKNIETKEYFYKDKFKTIKDLIMLLETTPIIPDFDFKKDKVFIEKAVKEYGLKNIEINRHRVILICK